MSSGSHGWSTYVESCGLRGLLDDETAIKGRELGASRGRRFALRLVTGILLIVSALIGRG